MNLKKRLQELEDLLLGQVGATQELSVQVAAIIDIMVKKNIAGEREFEDRVEQSREYLESLNYPQETDPEPFPKLVPPGEDNQDDTGGEVPEDSDMFGGRRSLPFEENPPKK